MSLCLLLPSELPQKAVLWVGDGLYMEPCWGLRTPLSRRQEFLEAAPTLRIQVPEEKEKAQAPLPSISNWSQGLTDTHRLWGPVTLSRGVSWAS